MMPKCKYCGVELPGDWRRYEHTKLCKNATPEVRYIHSGLPQRDYPESAAIIGKNIEGSKP